MTKATPARFAGFTKLPLRCPHCEHRSKERSFLHGSAMAVRCEKCTKCLYVVPAFGAHFGLVYVVEIELKEWKRLAAKAASPLEVLEALGLTVRAA